MEGEGEESSWALFIGLDWIPDTTAALSSSDLAALKDLLLLLQTEEAQRESKLCRPDFEDIRKQLIAKFAEAWHTPRSSTGGQLPRRSSSTAAPTHEAHCIQLCFPELLSQSRAAVTEAQRSGGSPSVLGKLWRYLPLPRRDGSSSTSGQLEPECSSSSPKALLEAAAARSGVTWAGLVSGYRIKGETMCASGWLDPLLLAAYGIHASDLLRTVPGFERQTLIDAAPNADELLALGLGAEQLVELFAWSQYQLHALWISSQDWVQRLGLTKQLLSGRMGLDRLTATTYLFHPERPEPFRWRLEDMASMGYTQQELVQLGLVLPPPLSQGGQDWRPHG